MENGNIKVWLPTVRAGTGTDVFTTRLAEALEQKGIATKISWFPLRYEMAPFLLRRATAPSGTNIIFTNSWNGFAFKRQSIPLVVTSHHPDYIATGSQLNLAQYLYHRVLIRQYEHASFGAADALTADSAFTGDSLKGTRWADKLEVIHLWTDVQKYHPPAQCHTAAGRPFRLLFVGNQSYRKGADLLPRIMRELGSDFRLDIVGRIGKEQDSTFPENMSALGWLSEDELIRAYQECDALLFPSRWEGFGYCVLEAMACGKPVVTSNAAALPEVVSNGTTGILCKTGSVESYVAACRRLAANPGQAISMGKAGRQRAVENFSEDKLVARYVDLIKRLVRPT